MDTSVSIVQDIILEELNANNVRLFVKRDDLIHETISGNKWRKLKYNVKAVKQKKKAGILTFGGAHSNHLIATAASCKEEGLSCIGIVRGDELNSHSNKTLQDCSSMGMELIFVSRETYKQRYERIWHEELLRAHPNYMIIPEGGANYYGIIGCQEILKEIDNPFRHLFVAQGTTTTSCGLLLGLQEDQELHVVPALRGFDSIREMRDLFLSSGIPRDVWYPLFSQITVHDEYDFGGYGKATDELIAFIKEFKASTDVPLDVVYTSKAMYALLDQVMKGAIKDTTVLFLHTGGLQGNRGFPGLD